MRKPFRLALFAICVCLTVANAAGRAWALASNNIPLDSPIYLYLDKLAGFGLIKADMNGIKPFSKAEAARLVIEAEKNLPSADSEFAEFAGRLISRLHDLIPRELSLHGAPEKAPTFDYNLFSSARTRLVYLDGVPRSYERAVNDPGGDRLFGIFGPLRVNYPFPYPVLEHGTEGTPLMENNEGIRYRKGTNVEFRFISEAFVGSWISFLVEPMLLSAPSDRFIQARLNEGYLKLGGEGLELEIGRDDNWLGFGFRGSGILTNNAQNLDIVKISSPESISLKLLGKIKYDFIFSRLDRTGVGSDDRQPFFYTATFLVKPGENFEGGINLGRIQGGPGVNNSLGYWLRGLYGGTNTDNSKSFANFEFRFRLPFLRNAEIYAEDTFSDLPSAESPLVGFYVPRLTAGGKDDFRFEYFRGHNVLYTSGTFPEGYVYDGMPLGHSQGGATEDFFFRYSHWFSVRNNLALEYFYTTRGTFGRLPGQAVERKNAGRVIWSLPLHGDTDMHLTYGLERVDNLNLVQDVNRTNQIINVEVSYRY